ncbi:MAG: hypothetical protein P8O03_14110, partial [Ilumatobacter sp.]|nr:hypothetical protein [Ilumatobacter sp.]
IASTGGTATSGRDIHRRSPQRRRPFGSNLIVTAAKRPGGPIRRAGEQSEIGFARRAGPVPIIPPDGAAT